MALINRIPEIARALEPIYREQGWTWGQITPDAVEIAGVLGGLYADLVNEADAESISTGRLVVARECDGGRATYNVYLSLGDIEDEGS